MGSDVVKKRGWAGRMEENFFHAHNGRLGISLHLMVLKQTYAL